jgi:hypothetical protein
LTFGQPSGSGALVEVVGTELVAGAQVEYPVDQVEYPVDVGSAVGVVAEGGVEVDDAAIAQRHIESRVSDPTNARHTCLPWQPTWQV